jgi:hypothetical protein
MIIPHIFSYLQMVDIAKTISYQLEQEEGVIVGEENVVAIAEATEHKQ